MKLSQAELDRFSKDGYLFFPGCFTPPEVEILHQAAADVYAMNRQEVWREKNGAPRTAFAAHRYNEVFRRLGAHPRLVGPVTQILGGPVYMHQFKVNAKAAFDGDAWPWHQDYGIWQREDDMPEPRAMNIAVFVDEVTAANGPLLFIPGSHKTGMAAADYDRESTSYPLWRLDRDTVARLSEVGGCVAPTGAAGSVLMFSSLLVHASPPNISPFSRTIVYLSLNRIDNQIRKFARKEWISHRDFAPIAPLLDSCLRDLSDATAAE